MVLSEEGRPIYSPNLSSSYQTGFNYAIKGLKSISHEERLLGKTKWDRGYADGWTKYAEDTLIKVLKNEVNS